MNKTKIDELLKKHMDDKNTTIIELSKKSNISESTIRRILNGRGGNIRINTIIQLCSGLHISISDFFK